MYDVKILKLNNIKYQEHPIVTITSHDKQSQK